MISEVDILGSIFIYFIIGNETNLCTNVPNILIFMFMLVLVLNIGMCFTYVSKTASSLYQRNKERRK